MRGRYKPRTFEDTKYLTECDFKEDFPFHDIAKGEEELEVDVKCYPIPRSNGSYYDPPEGGYVEDVTVTVNNGEVDLTDALTERAYEILAEELYDSYCDSQEDHRW